MNPADVPPQVQLTEQDLAYMVQTLLARPLGEALPTYLKLTGQQLVPVAARLPVPVPPAA